MPRNQQATTFSGDLTYANWKKWLKDSNHKKVTYNTYVRHSGGDQPIYIRLHETDVITYLPSGLYQLSNGGWYTQTTMRRIEQFSPAHIITCGPYCWSVRDAVTEVQSFRDGIVLGGWDLSLWPEARLRQFIRDTRRNLGIFEAEEQWLEYEHEEIVLIYSTWVFDSDLHSLNFSAPDPASWIDTHDAPLAQASTRDLIIWYDHALALAQEALLGPVRDFYRKKVELVKREQWERLTVRRKGYE